MCWKLARRRATDEFSGRLVRSHFDCKPDRTLAAVCVPADLLYKRGSMLDLRAFGGDGSVVY
jgi:hypothetical protein